MRRLFALFGIIVISLLLAFPLRGAVYDAIIVPAAYVFWVLGLVYHAVHQSLWWIVVIVFVLVVLVRSLLPKTKPLGRRTVKTKPTVGQVETLAAWVKKSERGNYFKWLIANRLGKIAYQVLSQRETGKTRSVFDPLTGSDWEPNNGVQTYLENGLHGSFTDHPRVAGLFSRPTKTPLDHDVSEAVDFLESQVGNK
jgi:hypothetical protein